jgi:hypothetical protein
MSCTPPNNDRLLQTIRSEITFSGHFQSDDAVLTPDLSDITGQNPNVALQLGLVHALGRPYRVVAQGDPEKANFPSLAKVQIHRYEGAPGFAGLAEAVEELLESAVRARPTR